MQGKVILDRIAHGDNERKIGRQMKFAEDRDKLIEDLIEPPTVNMGSPLVSASVYRLDGSIDIHLENSFFKLVGKFTPDQPKVFY